MSYNLKTNKKKNRLEPPNYSEFNNRCEQIFIQMAVMGAIMRLTSREVFTITTESIRLVTDTL